MDEKLAIRFIRHIWYKHMELGSLLVWDSFKAHLTEDVLKELARLQIHSVVIPGGCTSKAQPLDVSINKPLKGILRLSI